jgi:hypothetical protein
MALLRLGDMKLADLTTDNKAMRVCNAYLANTILEIIRIFPWNCSVVRARPVPVAEATDWVAFTAYGVGVTRKNGANLYVSTIAGTSAASGGPTGTTGNITDGTVVWRFLCSSTFVNLSGWTYAFIVPSDCVRVLDIDGAKKNLYRIEGPFLYTNVQNPVLRYAKLITVDEMDAVMVEGVVSRLASKICFIMTSNLQLMQLLYQEFATTLSISRQIAAAEDREDLIDILQLYTNAQIALRQDSVRE